MKILMEILELSITGLRPGEKLYEELLIGSDVIQSEHLDYAGKESVNYLLKMLNTVLM